MMRARARTVAAALACLAVLAFGHAQNAVVPSLERARETVLEARDAYEVRTPDRPLWAEALRLGTEALEARPGDPEALLFLARTYSEVRWFIRAWTYWQDFFAAGGTLDDTGRTSPDLADPDAPSSTFLFAEVGTELGFARYEADEPERAIPYYEAVLARLPEQQEALRWLGRIHFEAGRSEEALPSWERLAELRPEDPSVTYYLERTRDRLAVGVDAADAFERGIALYEDGDVTGALGAFEAALDANAQFADAAIWAGRSALDLGLSGRAVQYWERAVELAPGDDRAEYFLQVARTQAEFGAVATEAYYRGQGYYTEGDLEAANEAFVEAARAAEEFTQAWVWAARTHQELGRPAEAIFWWQGVLRLDPGDERARYFLDQAQNQLAYGVEAGEAFTRAVRAYQLADFATAEAAFREAVAANEEFAAAWGWLGRIAFSEERYADAEEAFGRAEELAPENEDYAFFADEARRLAGDEE
jgi:tetratricopeptide (TPR) repeat protein